MFQALFFLIDHRRTEFFCVTNSNAEQEAAEDQQTAKEWIQSLTPGQRALFRAAFGGAKNLKEIAEQKGVSEVAISKQAARIAEAVKKAGISGPDLMEALRDLYESDQKVFAQRDALYQGDLEENKKGPTYTGSSTGLSQSFPDYRRLTGDQKIASAALQYVKHIENNISPDKEKVKSAVSEIRKILRRLGK